ncbi:MAG TPA: hypothetical protein VLX92_25110 [Kofleriaceae bacterium]|nr:hypothetical protein [Kofleriaceae bacterium]
MKLAIVTVLAMLSAPALAETPSTPHALYRFDISIAGLDHDPATYSVFLEENVDGQVSTGANIPLATGTTTFREQTGLNMHFKFHLRDKIVVLEGDVELSTPTGGAVFHRVRAQGVVPINPGTPATFTSLYDITSHHRYEVSVTASRLL